MPAPPKHRNAIVNAAAVLFRRNGYAATGVNEIVEISGAPKGSLYHYFPGGKDAIGEAAVRFAGSRVTRTLERLAQEHRSTPALLREYGRLLAGWMTASEFRDGCPITTTLLEVAPESAAITAAGREAFAAWRDIITGALLRDGYAPADARRLSTLAIASIEGALILARAERSAQPIVEAMQALTQSLRAAKPLKPTGRKR
jgi:TetR/AcrR family transcriptional repressor of lmrAB and yxaGH operons